MIILGIDPGLATIGYGILQYNSGRFKVLDYGCIRTEAKIPTYKRLNSIFIEINRLINSYHPDVMAVEELFFNTNVTTAINVGQGRGVIILSAAISNISVFEYTPLQVKQAVVGYGRATKQQIQQMVKIILNLNSIPKPDDTADALAVAICHAHSYNENIIYNT